MKISRFFLLFCLALTAGLTFAATPRWVDLKDEDGDLVRVDRQGTRVQVDQANTIGWGAQKMKVYYRFVYKQPVQVPNGGPLVDEERFEINVGCSNGNKVRLIEKSWYLNNKHTHVFTYGSGRIFPALISENPAVYHIVDTACPEFDPNAREDADEFPFSGK
jgi:hypothetical protein